MITSEKIKIVCISVDGVFPSKLEQLLEGANFDFAVELSVINTRSDVLARLSSHDCDVLILPIDWSRASSIDLAIRARSKSAELTLIALHNSPVEGELMEAMESVFDEYWDTCKLDEVEIIQSFELALERRSMLCELATELEGSREAKGMLENSRVVEKVSASSSTEPLGGLTGGLAHNLNNLMMGVLGNAELLKADFELDNLTLARLKKMENSAQKASDLCQRLLSFSGQGNLAVQNFDVSELLESVREIVSEAMPDGAKLQYSIDRDLPKLHGDPTEIRQLILNLAINAGEAVDNHGSISISCGECRLSKTELAEMTSPCTFEAGQYMYFEIKDDGTGIDSFTLNKVFEPFFTTKSDGRGLGLPASLGIVKAHSGALDISSDREGTNIRVFFPLVLTEQRSDDLDKEEQMDSPVIKKVLVVDDEDVLRMVVSSLLKLFGYEPVVAANGEEALELYDNSEDNWAFAMIDLNMPGISGLDLYSKIKDKSPDLPVLVMSGDGEEPEGLLLNTSSSGYLMKPFGMDDLKTAISGLVELPVI